MALDSLGSAVMAAIAAVMVAAPILGADAEATPSRATRQEISQACRAAGGLEWGTEADGAAESGADRSGRYGCITSRGWVACDRHGNCAGGSGAAQRLGARPPTPAGDRGQR